MKAGNILMIVENYFPYDPRVKKEADALLEKNYGITVIALKKLESERFHEISDGTEIFRIPSLPHFTSGRMKIILEYVYFTLISSLIFLCSHIIKRYKVIHVHNPPDIFFIVGLLGKLFSVKFIFDHHDLWPEFRMKKVTNRKDFIYKTLFLCEKMSCRLADIVISTNESYKQMVVQRHNLSESKVHIVRNGPFIDEFVSDGKEKEIRKGEKKYVLLFLGCVNHQDGLDTLMYILNCLVYKLGKQDIVCLIVGGGGALPYVKRLADELHLGHYVDFKGHIFDRQKIKEYLNSADICIEPAPQSEFNERSTFIKVMEYMACGKPVVAFDLQETRYTTDNSAILVQPGDIAGFAFSIKRLIDEPSLREDLGKKGSRRVRQELAWEKNSVNLTEAYESLA